MLYSIYLVYIEYICFILNIQFKWRENYEIWEFSYTAFCLYLLYCISCIYCWCSFYSFIAVSTIVYYCLLCFYYVFAIIIIFCYFVLFFLNVAWYARRYHATYAQSLCVKLTLGYHAKIVHRILMNSLTLALSERMCLMQFLAAVVLEVLEVLLRGDVCGRVILLSPCPTPAWRRRWTPRAGAPRASWGRPSTPGTCTRRASRGSANIVVFV